MRKVSGRPKRHRLLLVLDEFPQLGRMPFFETTMGAMAGYGIKAYLVCQSPNHIARAYGRDNVIVDNCHIVTAFAAADADSAKRIAAMAGDAWEVREQDSEQKPRALFGLRKGSTTYKEEQRPLLTAGDVRQLPQDEQLVFVSGVKPLRTKKLQFDREKLFRKRLRPSAHIEVRHDWEDVAPLGRLEIDARGQMRVIAPTNQGDLFTPSSLSNSEKASVGLRPTPSRSRGIGI